MRAALLSKAPQLPALHDVDEVFSVLLADLLGKTHDDGEGQQV